MTDTQAATGPATAEASPAETSTLSAEARATSTIATGAAVAAGATIAAGTTTAAGAAVAATVAGAASSPTPPSPPASKPFPDINAMVAEEIELSSGIKTIGKSSIEEIRAKRAALSASLAHGSSRNASNTRKARATSDTSRDPASASTDGQHPDHGYKSISRGDGDTFDPGDRVPGDEKIDEHDPLAVQCGNCGHATNFDVVHQTYLCPACHTQNKIGPTRNALNQWRLRRLRHSQDQRALFADQVVLTHCPQCGADVTYPGDEAVSTCAFCKSVVVREAFINHTEFPEQIIPFFIQLDEAKRILNDWIRKHPFKREARAIKDHVDELQAFYLPYQKTKGMVEYEVEADNETYDFNLFGHVDGVLINASEELDNLLLEGMEPYDWSAAKPFELAYLSNQPTKLQNLANNEVIDRLYEEMAVPYTAAACRKLHTSAIDLKRDSDDIISMAVLLPAFIITTDDVQLAINGQTGRISVVGFREKIRFPWFIAPTVLTLLLTAPLGWFFWPDYRMVLVSLILVAAMVFTIFDRGTRLFRDRKILHSRAFGTTRDEDSVLHLATHLSTSGPAPFSPPRFLYCDEDDGYKSFLADVSFYTPSRVAIWSTAAILWNLLPLLIAILINFIRYKSGSIPEVFYQFTWGGSLAWWCITVPVTIAYFLRFSFAHLFKFPVLKYKDEDGRTVRRKLPLDDAEGLGEMLSDLPVKVYIIVGLIALFLLLGSVGATIWYTSL